jgi:hypothetical protein
MFRRELITSLSPECLSLSDEQRAAINAHLDHQTAELAGHFDDDIND